MHAQRKIICRWQCLFNHKFLIEKNKYNAININFYLHYLQQTEPEQK